VICAQEEFNFRDPSDGFYLTIGHGHVNVFMDSDKSQYYNKNSGPL